MFTKEVTVVRCNEVAEDVAEKVPEEVTIGFLCF